MPWRGRWVYKPEWRPSFHRAVRVSARESSAEGGRGESPCSIQMERTSRSSGSHRCPLPSAGSVLTRGGSSVPPLRSSHPLTRIFSCRDGENAPLPWRATEHRPAPVRGGRTAPGGEGAGLLCLQPDGGALRMGFGTALQELCLQKPLD